MANFNAFIKYRTFECSDRCFIQNEYYFDNINHRINNEEIDEGYLSNSDLCNTYIYSEDDDITTMQLDQYFDNIEKQTINTSQDKINLLYYNINESDIKKNLSCSICIKQFKDKLNVIKLLCNHVYHKKCIIKWLKEVSNCPICRKEVDI